MRLRPHTPKDHSHETTATAYGAFARIARGAPRPRNRLRPYNPDSNNDSLINAIDLLDLIPLYAQPFLPSPDDLDSTNEIQSLFLSGDTLFLIPDGGFIQLTSLAANLDSSLAELLVESSGIEDSIANLHIIDADLDGIPDAYRHYDCATACNRLITPEGSDWRILEGRDVERNADVLLPALLSAYPNDDLDPSSTIMWYWIDDEYIPGSKNDRFLLTINDQNVQYSARNINNDSTTGGTGEDLPFGCVCVRQP